MTTLSSNSAHSRSLGLLQAAGLCVGVAVFIDLAFWLLAIAGVLRGAGLLVVPASGAALLGRGLHRRWHGRRWLGTFMLCATLSAACCLPLMIATAFGLACLGWIGPLGN